MKKRIWMLFLAALLVMAGCAKDQGQDKAADDQGRTEAEVQEGKEDQAEASQDKVTLKLEDGQVWVKLNPQNWPQLAGKPGWVQDIDFSPVRVEGRVLEACAGEIWGPHQALDKEGEIALPVLVLLMEDGTLEWTLIDPAWCQDMVETDGDCFVHSYGKILWLEDMVSLAYEYTKEGTGQDMTILAFDKNGVAYDLRYALNLQALPFAVWPTMVDLQNGISAHLYFSDDGTLTLDKVDRGEVITAYYGTYQVHLATEGQGAMRPGVISLDLALAEGQWAPDEAPKTIRGDYFAEIGGEDNLELLLYLADGDPLHSLEGKGIEEYNFRMPTYYSSDFVLEEATDEDLVIHLLANTPEANHLVEVLGMSALVTGETTDFGDGFVCRDVWLGTNDEASFVKEILYTICPDGTVYKYDPIGDAWDIASIYIN